MIDKICIVRIAKIAKIVHKIPKSFEFCYFFSIILDKTDNTYLILTFNYAYFYALEKMSELSKWMLASFHALKNVTEKMAKLSLWFMRSKIIIHLTTQMAKIFDKFFNTKSAVYTVTNPNPLIRNLAILVGHQFIGNLNIFQI